MGLKRAFKSALKFNKYVFDGTYVRKGLKSGVKFAKSNPELLAIAGTAVGGPAVGGALGGLFGARQEQVGEGVVYGGGGYTSPGVPGQFDTSDPFAQSEFAAPISKNVLIIGAIGLGAILLLKK